MNAKVMIYINTQRFSGIKNVAAICVAATFFIVGETCHARPAMASGVRPEAARRSAAR